MEIDVFPVVTPGASIDWALDTLAQWQRSALVVEDRTRYSFVEAADLVIARSEGLADTLEPLTKRTPLRLLRLVDLRLETLDFRVTGQAELERVLQPDERFILLAVTDSRAIVASRSELDMPAQAGPRDCYCKVDRKEVSPGVHGGDCPHDHRHRGSVRCR